MGLLVDLLIIAVAIAISLLITVPITGALVRLRANYNPKSLQLDDEGVVHPYTGPQLTSFFGMLFRVKRLEGWAGLYKGLMPHLITAVIMTSFSFVFYDSSGPRNHGMANPPRAGPFGVLIYSIFWMIITLPAMVISYRSVTTPYKLPYLGPRYSLRILLTPTERRKPWLLYLTPGLLPAQLVAVTYGVLGLRTLRHFLLPGYRPGADLPESFTPLRFGLYFIVVIISTAILCPLEVIATKLAIQRNHASAEFNSVHQEEEGDTEETAEYAGAEEDVIGLRDARDPYTGLVDCAKRIAQEEGAAALYRAWWVTMLACVATAFSV